MSRDSIVARGYDAMAEDYLAAIDTPGLRAQAQRYIGWLRENAPAGARLLDLGCGAGVPFTRALAEHFAVTGVDFSARQVALARDNVPDADFVQADISTLEPPGASFDVITAFFSIIHLDRELHEPLVERIARWLAPGGLFVATFGTKDDPGKQRYAWLGVHMTWSSFDSETNRAMVARHLEIVSAEEETVEDGVDGAETFLWVIARR